MTEPKSPYDFVELNRNFHELSQQPQNDEADLSHLFRAGDRLGWPDLIREYRVVLLAEAGSGKTEEIRNIAHKLRGEGKAAFFVRLEHIPSDFEDAFEVGSFEEFKEWLVSSEEGWLFLDSIDEARLRSPRDFERAIRKLARQISTAKERSHVVITGRAYAWRPQTDLTLCTQHLPFTAPTRTVAATQQMDESGSARSVRTAQQSRPSETFKVVTLDDLSSDQIKAFATARGLTDTTEFLHAVEQADAWSFTSRPQDLEELTEFWIDQGRIGSRLELMQNSITRRLTERDQDRADARPLSLQDARKGARLLAAATTLMQEPTIRVPDGADNAKGIPLSEVLPDWDDTAQAALLSRPIFDEAIYGTVRFHHRSVREYLTAEWLAALLERDTSRRKIETLLFRNQYGLDVIVPTLRPVLPWLAILDNKVRERLRKIAPEVVFEGGDPSRLPLDLRRTILHEICEQIGSGTSSRSVESYDAVQRFANTDLAQDIKSLMEKYADNNELTGFLLRMIWLGELTAALPEAKSVALSTSASKYTRIAAFRAVNRIGSEKDREEIRKGFLKEAPELERAWLAELIKGTTPSSDTNTWLLDCLAKSKAKERYSIEPLTDAVQHFAQEADIALLPPLLSGFNELLSRAPFIERRFCQISTNYAWLLPAAAVSVERLIQEQHSAVLDPQALSVLRKIRMARGYGTDDLRDERSDLAALVSAWPDLNRAVFWYDIEAARARLEKKCAERLDEFWKASVFDAFWRFDASDFEYVIQQISSQPLGDNQLVALSLAFRLYVDNGRPRKWREKLKSLVTGDSELSARLAGYLRPPSQDKEARRWKQQEASWKRRAEERARKEKAYHEGWKKFLAENVDTIRSPKVPKPQISNAQYYLHEQMREKSNDKNRWTDGEWESLISEYGEAVARAFRDSAASYWRRYRPMLQSEGAPKNETPFAVIFGLSGLSIEAREVADWPNTLTEAEVKLACRYTAYELNGFPTWFPKLYEMHPVPVTKFLLKELEYELSIEKQGVDTHYVLDDLSWSGEWAWDGVAPRLIALLRKAEPRNLGNLRKLLTIVQGSSTTDDEVRKLAVKKCGAIRRHKQLALWYAVWTGVDPAAAIPAFAHRLQKIARSEDRLNMAMNYVTNLWGDRRSETARARQAFQTPQHLKALYLLMHEHIQSKDDIDRAGKGVYSPELRDEAQKARNGLFTLLNRIPGKDAFLALEEISRVHPEESSRPWFVLHAKTKAEQDADISSWAPSQVREFQDRLERTPRNHNELSELAVLRLLDLKDDLENGDSSIAQILREVKIEVDMRKYIGRELREKASNRYSIPQEEELADAKKPDLRFHGVSFDAPVPVELKLADNWAGPELFERLENQLCGDYLRDNRSTRGIFVLVYRGEKTGWDTPGAPNRVDFDGLVAALQGRWEQLSPSFPRVDEATVIGIDLTKRVR